MTISDGELVGAPGIAEPGIAEPTGDKPAAGEAWVMPMTRARNFSPWAQVQLELAAITPAESVPHVGASVPGWRARTRGRLTDLLGHLPRPVVPDAEISDRVECNTYTRERIVFDTEATMSVPAYLLVPNGRRRPGPAVIAIHGHGPGKDQIVGLDSEAAGRAPGDASRDDYARQLVEAGYVVLAPDLRCFGERADGPPGPNDRCDANLVAAVAAGRNPLSGNLHDLVCALDVMAEHPLIDASRVGVVGFSYGATMALFLAAWDTRIRAAVVSGYFSSWKAAQRVPGNLCGSQVLFGMLGQLEHVDLGALVAPRALLVESGTGDALFPVETATAALAELASVYVAMRAPTGTLEHHVFDGDHRWDGATALAFLERWL